MKYFRYLRSLSSLLIVGLFSSISFAQTDISGVIVNPESDGLSIQIVQDDLLTPVSTAQVFRLLSDQSKDWYIGTEENVALSPNGMYLAIAATRADESLFFTYDLQTGTQRQYPLAAEASRVQWSANSTLLLISLVSGNTANVLYDYQADTFLPERQLYIGFGSQYVLLPDGITTIYAGIDSTCSVDCSGEDIYIANINDPNPLPITNLRSLVPAYAIPNICDFTWSESQQLIYVYACYLPESANNNPDLDIYIGTIYGFDLAGNLQFSLSMESLFTGDLAGLGEAGQFPLISTGSSQIQLLSDANSVYIISQLIIAGNSHERHLMVHRIDAGNVLPIFTLTQPLQNELRLIDAELSQNGQVVALSTIVRPWERDGFAALNLIDGTTGQVLQNLTDTEQGLCELHWSGTSTLIIKLGASLNCANRSSVTGFASFDVITSMTTLLTDGDAFFLPRLR